MATGTITPTPWFTGLDDDGSVLVAGLLYVYLAGTSTLTTTYSDVNLTTPNANPVVLDAAGRATVFLTAQSVKYVLKRSDGTTVRTQDNIASVAVGQSGGLGEIFVFGGDNNSPTVSASYPTGATFDKLAAGTAVYEVDSANLNGTYVVEGTLMSGGGAVTAALVNLDDGAPDTAIVEITSTSTTGELKQSSAITWAAAGTAKKYGIKIKVASGQGYGWGFRIKRTA